VGEKDMNKKIIGIFIIALLTISTMTTIATKMSINNYIESRFIKPTDVPRRWLVGADQYQTDNVPYGFVLSPKYHIAQEFKPTKEDLTAVALNFFQLNAPSNVEITVSIRETLNGINLTTKIVNADDKQITDSGTWVMFDFDDIIITPEESYYIVCYASDGEMGFSYLWLFDVDDKYNRGIGWESNNSGETWSDLEDPGWGSGFFEIDLCFITYYQKPPKIKPVDISLFLQNIIQRFPMCEKILNQII
jgi:hypothetical protein